jgi:hypothetical protein
MNHRQKLSIIIGYGIRGEIALGAFRIRCIAWCSLALKNRDLFPVRIWAAPRKELRIKKIPEAALRGFYFH